MYGAGEPLFVTFCNDKIGNYQQMCITSVTMSEMYYCQENIIQKLMIFERKILRKIFGPTKEVNGLWRIKANDQTKKYSKVY